MMLSSSSTLRFFCSGAQNKPGVNVIKVTLACLRRRTDAKKMARVNPPACFYNSTPAYLRGARFYNIESRCWSISMFYRNGLLWRRLPSAS